VITIKDRSAIDRALAFLPFLGDDVDGVGRDSLPLSLLFFFPSPLLRSRNGSDKMKSQHGLLPPPHPHIQTDYLDATRQN
jgi:hypothetical protein